MGIWKAIKEKRKMSYMKRFDTLELKMKQEFGIIYGQCTKSLQLKLDAVKGWT